MSKTKISGSNRVTLRKKPTKDGYSLYLDISQDGQRYKEYLKLSITPSGRTTRDREVLQKAELVRAMRMSEIENANLRINSRQRMSEDFIGFFASKATEKQMKRWRSTLKHLRNYSGGAVPFKRVTATWLAEFQAYLRGEVSDNSAATYYETVKAALNIAVRDKIIPSNPATEIKGIRRKDSMRQFLEEHEIKLLHETPCYDPLLKAAFLFDCFCGVRWGDLRMLQEKHIVGTSLRLIQQKTSDEVLFPLPEMALRYLPTRIGVPTKKIFPLLGLTYCQRYIGEWVTAAGITKHITPHCARHTFATMALSNGVDIYMVMKMLGHTEIKTTMKYLHLVDANKRSAAAKFPVW